MLSYYYFFFVINVFAIKVSRYIEIIIIIITWREWADGKRYEIISIKKIVQKEIRKNKRKKERKCKKDDVNKKKTRVYVL